jgi:dimethyladenosine transferase 2, mitochondrial
VSSKPSEKPKILYPLKDGEKLPPYFEPCRSLTAQDFVPNINIFTEFGDLTPTQVFTLFDLFINWPEYKDSSFKPSLDSMLMKMNAAVESPANDIEKIDTDLSISPNKKE